MNKLVFGLFLFISNVNFAQSNIEKEKLAIRLIMDAQEAKWNEGDIAGFMGYYWNSDSLLFIGSKGATYGWNKTLGNYQKSYPNKQKMGELKFGIIKLELIDSDNAYCAGSWKLTRQMDILKGHFTLWWKKIDGQWKIIADHSSSE